MRFYKRGGMTAMKKILMFKLLYANVDSAMPIMGYGRKRKSQINGFLRGLFLYREKACVRKNTMKIYLAVPLKKAKTIQVVHIVTHMLYFNADLAEN